MFYIYIIIYIILLHNTRIGIIILDQGEFYTKCVTPNVKGIKLPFILGSKECPYFPFFGSQAFLARQVFLKREV